MQKVIPYILLIIAGIVAYYSFFGEEGYGKLTSLQGSVEQQKERNRALSDEVRSLKNEVHGLQTDSREIEKAARNELGMARPDEIILFFDKAQTRE